MKINLLLSHIDLNQILAIRPPMRLTWDYLWNNIRQYNWGDQLTGAIMRAYVPDEVTINRAYTVLNRNHDTTTEGVFHYG